MISFRTIARTAVHGLFATALGVALGCNSNDSNSPTAPGPVAIFTPDTPSPGNGTIVLLAGTSDGTKITVRVAVTGVSQFFGTTFSIKYKTTALQFNGMTTTDSFLLQGVTSDDVLFIEEHRSTPGEIAITATRKNPTVAPPIDVTTTSDLVVLDFTARLALAPGAADGRLDFADPKQVCDGTVVPPGCHDLALPDAAWSGGGVSTQ